MKATFLQSEKLGQRDLKLNNCTQYSNIFPCIIPLVLTLTTLHLSDIVLTFRSVAIFVTAKLEK
jgi:hypothetical protein